MGSQRRREESMKWQKNGKRRRMKNREHEQGGTREMSFIQINDKSNGDDLYVFR